MSEPIIFTSEFLGSSFYCTEEQRQTLFVMEGLLKMPDGENSAIYKMVNRKAKELGCIDGNGAMILEPATREAAEQWGKEQEETK